MSLITPARMVDAALQERLLEMSASPLGLSVPFVNGRVNCLRDLGLFPVDVGSQEFGDEYWTKRGWQLYGDKWAVESTFYGIGVQVQPGYPNRAPAETILDDEDLETFEYNDEVQYGMAPDALYKLLQSSTHRVDRFLKAEGLLVRCMLASPGWKERLFFVKVWAILYWKQVHRDSDAMYYMVSAVQSLNAAYRAGKLTKCSGGADMLTSVTMHLQAIELESKVWKECFVCIIKLRKSYKEPAHCCGICPRHGGGCTGNIPQDVEFECPSDGGYGDNDVSDDDLPPPYIGSNSSDKRSSTWDQVGSLYMRR